MPKDFMSAVQDRRTIYGISPESTISYDRLKEVIDHAVKYTPSAFNSQTAKVVILLGEHHDKLWNITKAKLKKIVPESNFPATETKINSFKNGFGTIMYFEDQAGIQAMQQQFPTYADNFPLWSLQSSGMLQYVIWTALEIEGLGASLQHYNPLIDDDVRQEWNIPASWKLIAAMPFGTPTVMPDEKEFKPLEERVLVFK